MRRLLTCVGLASLAFVGQLLWAQGPPLTATPAINPTLMTVLPGDFEVLSQPSSYATSQVRGGEQVVVLGESTRFPGWVQIVPPKGSFSYIDARYVKTFPGVDKIGVVVAGDATGTAPIMPGSSYPNNRDPNVESARVKPGFQVVIIAPVVSLLGTSLYPIAPVATESRYLPINAVRQGGGNAPWGPIAQTGGNQPYYPQNNWNQTQVQPQQQQPTSSLQELDLEAKQAIQAGNIDRAKLIYVDALGQTNDPAWQTYLRGELARLSPNAGQSPYMATSSPGYQAYQPSNGYQPTAGYQPNQPGLPAQNQKTWTDWGVLRSTLFTTREGQKMFLLEKLDGSGSPIIYVTTQPGTSLDGLVGRTMTLYGTVAVRNDDNIRMQYIIAEQLKTN